MKQPRMLILKFALGKCSIFWEN